VRQKVTPVNFSSFKGRALQDTQVYSKLYYKSKLKAIVDEELKDKAPKKQERFAKVMEVTKREWAKESEEVKETVRRKRDEMQQAKDKPSPAAIDNLSHVVHNFLRHLRQTTGWTGFLVIGGPQPDTGGELAIAS
jgi:molecular chaperone GrpE (heat shock protein)